MGFVEDRNAAVKGARGLGIHVLGLEDLRKSLRDLDKEIDKALRKDLREAAKPVLARARANVPTGGSGALARSLRISVQTRGVALGSRLQYANLVHWGGSTGRGHVQGRAWSGSVKVRESLFLSRALVSEEDQLLDALDAAVGRAAERAGF